MKFGNPKICRTDQIAVGKTVSHFIFDGEGEVVFAAFLWPRVTNLVAELDFYGEAVEQDLVRPGHRHRPLQRKPVRRSKYFERCRTPIG